MKLNVFYDNKITRQKITECFELDEDDDTIELKIDLLKFYLKKVCPYIDIDKCIDYYDDKVDYTRTQIYLRLDHLILEEIEYINFFNDSELINFSMNIEEHE